MKLDQIISEFEAASIRELAPMTNVAGATTVAPAAGATTMAPGQQVQQDPQAQAKMMAQQALDRQNKKKEIQDQIRLKQQELQELQKQLAQIK
jgi:hypothetical protein